MRLQLQYDGQLNVKKEKRVIQFVLEVPHMTPNKRKCSFEFSGDCLEKWRLALMSVR